MKLTTMLSLFNECGFKELWVKLFYLQMTFKQYICTFFKCNNKNWNVLKQTSEKNKKKVLSFLSIWDARLIVDNSWIEYQSEKVLKN